MSENKKTSAWTLSRTICSDKSVGRALMRELASQMDSRDWHEHEVLQVHTAYDEAIVNAIIHGNKQIKDATVDVTMSCDNDRVIIQITDRGRGFDPNNVPDPRRGKSREISGGRGLLLMRQIMNTVAFNEQGNQVTLIKRRGKD